MVAEVGNTVRVTDWLVTSSRFAVISVVPAVSPVTIPPAEMVAMLLSELVHVTSDLMIASEPSE
jgi:hypothetical protein